jgi:hypothetical protein
MQKEGISIDYLGVWNERYWGGPDYVKSLRASLDVAGFSDTRIIIPDGLYDAAIMAAAASDASFNASFDGVGLHYPCEKPHPEVQAGGKLFWASEDWWSQPSWSGAAAWGHLTTQNYVLNNMTSTIAWSPLWSVYDDLQDEQAGLILASEPWSGSYEVSPPVWTGAQWSQFTEIGWRFLSVPSGGSGRLPDGGFYVSLVPPEGETGLTVILETLDSPRCPSPVKPTAAQTVTFRVAGGAPLPAPGSHLFVYQTNATAAFVNLPDVVIAADGTFSVSIAPDTIVTLSTVAGARKGAPKSPIPPSAPFPFPYADDFSAVAEDGMARYFADEFGSFAVRGGRLTQVAGQNPGANGWTSNGDPLSVLGDSAWRDYEISATVVAPSPPASGLADGLAAQLQPCSPAAAEQQWTWDSVAPGYLSGALGECFNVYGCKSDLVYWQCVTSGGTCCGADCYAGLEWARPTETDGFVVSALPGGLCATASTPVSAASTLSLAPCAGAAGQRWDYNESARLLALRGTGLCLSQPPPGPAYARVCGRIAGFNEFNSRAPLPGYCVQLRSDGTWLLTGGARVLANGTLLQTREPVPVALSMQGTRVRAYVNSMLVADVVDDVYTVGRAAVGTSWGGEGSFGQLLIK